jgi:hypothetical protein
MAKRSKTEVVRLRRLKRAERHLIEGGAAADMAALAAALLVKAREAH